MPEIVVHEVGPRDGLQIEHTPVPTETKLAWIESLAAAGVDVIQVGSFVNPKAVPQMADTDEMFKRLREPGRPAARAVLSCLVLNQKGLDRALATDVDLVCMGVSASETHSKKNTKMTVAEATTEILGMARAAEVAGRRVQVSVQSAFGCGFEGKIAEEAVVAIARRFVEAGCRTISLADTAGHATPEAVASLFSRIKELGEVELACHFHDTYGLALANCVAALNVGVKYIETSVASLGGCPFTAIAGGNACTEDFVHYLHRRGLRRDIDLTKVIDVARDVARFFNREMPGSVYKTGPIPEIAPVGA